ncbi:hypothetical protein A2154_00545 [Candidatus Gottesmanbacteria bacterium RBG_16_43_7]|uniref:DUF5667 domain-containing protein n=1 Tax=Candidatus Gottesmanbacteria bacterium RBG_16_43_7 TaxID=1798373 RepID=A0A1F5Z8F0_9BACT|nr:MAG: hypothetical protein A2154_00545 [Candidatus Gottesmanbacteria bacterium RBG_16_43_7]
MKHILVAAILALLVSIIPLPGTQAHAQSTKEAESEIGGKTPDAGMAESETAAVKIDYTLPYPGILTDHPLYMLKAWRDLIMQIFIIDPVKKIEFQILQSDKFFGMGIMYVSDNKWESAQNVFTRSVNATEQAIKMTAETNQGISKVPVMTIEHIEKSLQKHQELLQEMASGRSGSQKDILTTELERASQLRQKVQQLLAP